MPVFQCDKDKYFSSSLKSVISAINPSPPVNPTPPQNDNDFAKLIAARLMKA